MRRSWRGKGISGGGLILLSVGMLLVPAGCRRPAQAEAQALRLINKYLAWELPPGASEARAYQKCDRIGTLWLYVRLDIASEDFEKLVMFDPRFPAPWDLTDDNQVLEKMERLGEGLSWWRLDELAEPVCAECLRETATQVAGKPSVFKSVTLTCTDGTESEPRRVYIIAYWPATAVP